MIPSTSAVLRRTAQHLISYSINVLTVIDSEPST
jgi:hypothetical protein